MQHPAAGILFDQRGALTGVPVHQGVECHAAFSSISTLSYEQLLAEELGQETVDGFTREVAALGVNPADYHFMLILALSINVVAGALQ